MNAPRLYALDEHGRHVEPMLGSYPAGSAFAWPGCPATLDVTDSAQIGDRLVLLDVDTLQASRVDRHELDGKWQCPYDAAELRAHLEAKVADCRRFRLRYDTRLTERALRRLASAGAPSTWRHPLTRAHPEHPAEDHDFMRPRRPRAVP